MRLVVVLCCVLQLSFALEQEKFTPAPPDFIWGSATAAYQVEGAVHVGGRGQTNWDLFSHTPNKTHNGDTGDVAVDFYHRFHEDIQHMKAMGVKGFRFSLAWSRILPTGKPPVNNRGIRFYNELIDALLAAGIQPLVTLYHWDLPLGIDPAGTGWLHDNITDAFAVYADTAFNAFSDRVKMWLTFNEPLSFCNIGFNYGANAPGRCSDRTKCPAGSSSTESYMCAHNVLNAHAKAVDIYRRKYQQRTQGKIGISLNSDWAEPYSSSAEDVAASERYLIWQAAWFADPVWFGDYPSEMRELVGDRLPKFTDAEKALLRGSSDFYGLNHYTSKYVKNRPPGLAISSSQSSRTHGKRLMAEKNWDYDQGNVVSPTRNGVPIGLPADSDWLYVVPWGFRNMLNWISKRYNRPPIYVTENGVDVPNETFTPFPQVLNDTFRVDYYRQYIENMFKAVNEDNVNVRGYYAWSYCDNFEWADGYNKRFGLHYIDYKTLRRYAKESAKWYQWRISATP